MAFAFDTLGYAKRLREGGVPQDQAEVHAEAGREFVMAELVTRHDLAIVHNDLAVFRNDLDTLRRELEGAIERQSLRQTIRTGVMLAASIAVLATIIQLS
jgi:hypothetical protein